MIELMETILSFPAQGHYGYPIRLDEFNAEGGWEWGTWSDSGYAIDYLFNKCELFDYELNEWYIKGDGLYIVVVRKD